MSRKIHLIGIGGTGMGALAILLKEAGHEVRGSDQGVYPPMADMLSAASIRVFDGYDAANLSWEPDLVVIGNVVSKNHPEVRATLDADLAYRSFPQTLYEQFLHDRHPVVVVGTHGKTSTSSWVAWLLEAGGFDPGFLIGGVPANFGAGARGGTPPYFVVEGDEYETAFFDKGPKMWHYGARSAILTSIEFDHAEMFRDLGEIKTVFRKFVAALPADGFLAVCGDDPVALGIAREAPCPIAVYGLGKEAEWRGEVVEVDEEGLTARVVRGGREWLTLRSPLTGLHNLRNLLGAIAVVDHHGMARGDIAGAVPAFGGVARRQQLLGTVGGVRVIDDFAHHPTSVRETLDGIRARYGEARLWAVFEPRTNTSRRRVFQSEYPASFDAADRIVVAAVHEPHRAPAGDRFSAELLVKDLKRRGRTADHLPTVEAIVAHLKRHCRDGDVVAFLSNGSFGGIHRTFLKQMGSGTG